jgi:hypothetical protein
MPQAATQTDPIILAILSTMPQAATQVLQHADASTQTEPRVLRNSSTLLETETKWSRMILALLIETDCEHTMKTTRNGWTIEQSNERSREVNACFTYNTFLITSDWVKESALWRRCGRLTRDIILLRAWVSTGILDWPILFGRLNEFVSTLDKETAAKFVSQLCTAYDRLFPAMAASRQSAMHGPNWHPKLRKQTVQYQ